MCGGICGAKNNREATRGFWIEEDKNTLEAYQDSYAQAASNHPSTKSKMPKIGRSPSLLRGLAMLYIFNLIFSKNISSNTLAKLSKTLFSLNSNFDIGGSSAKAPPPKFIVGA
ncbi:hypothetical protein DVH24_019757 [Malus domestica]|uniref:Uncharacterized protein n=1 Tax=Malus domestica TaxID=3750 RepID=A0A498I1Q8_MALDO|nr:hypothetical protein DVH24_019757 [Malus domestica]